MRVGNNQKATVFDPKNSENRRHTVTATVSTYEGKDMGGKALFCSWWTNFVGQAYHKALDLHHKEPIVITNAKVENWYDKEKDKLYVTLTVFDFERPDGQEESTQPAESGEEEPL